MRTIRLPSLFLVASVVFATVFGLWTTEATAATSAVTLPAKPGDLVRGHTYSSVFYVGEDGFRYVFPNEQTYASWYPNFSTVKWISDADLGKMQIGGNVTYKPGSTMIKIVSDPRTFVVDHGGVMRHVETEATAKALYGSAWASKVKDLPEVFYSNYTIGAPVASASDYSRAAASTASATISLDKSLQPYDVVYLTDEGIVSQKDGAATITVEAGDTVLWANTGTQKHTATSEEGSWGTGTILPGGWFVKRFTQAGVYPYFDSYFPQISSAVYAQ